MTVFMNSAKGYPYYSRIYPIFSKEPIYLESNQHKCISFPILIFQRLKKSNGKTICGSIQ